MKIALFAGDRIALEMLQHMMQINCAPVCLVLDKADERGINAELIEAYQGSADSIITSDKLSDPQAQESLRSLSLDLITLAWWPKILKKEIIEIPAKGCLNCHPSLLPYGRGKDPNFWALAHEEPYGVTLHLIDEGVDTGPILFQTKIDYGWEDSGETLYKRAQEEILKLFKSSLDDIVSGSYEARPQDLGEGSSHLRRELDDASRVDLQETYTGRRLLNLLRARTFFPHPGAWFEDEGKKYQVRIQIEEVKDIDG